MHSALDKLENGGGHEDVLDAVELFPRRSDLSYRYVTGQICLVRKRKTHEKATCRL